VGTIDARMLATFSLRISKFILNLRTLGRESLCELDLGERSPSEGDKHQSVNVVHFAIANTQ